MKYTLILLLTLIILSGCGSDAFLLWNYIETQGGVGIVHCNRDLAKITVPDEYNDQPVVSIGYKALAGKINTHTIVIPNSVEIVEDFALAGCLRLNKIDFGISVKQIGSNAFA